MYDPLSSLNSQLSRHRLSRYIGVVLFFLSLFTYLGYVSTRFGLDNPPWSVGDEPSYDSIGWELSQGNGFSEQMNDPEFRAPYEQAARRNSEFPALSKFPNGPTTIRAPLFPIVIAATDLLFGRQFWAVRLLNILAVSAICGLVASTLYRLAGVIPALMGAFLFVVVDFHTRLYARAIMSEAIAGLLVAVMVLALFKFANTFRKRWLVVAALMFGLSILSRNIFVLWLPGMLLLLFWLQRKKPRDAFLSLLLFTVVTIFVASPWMIRNCIALGSFKPMGTQGLTQLAAGYSEIAWEHQGVWQNLDQYDFFDSVTRTEMTTLEKELAKAAYSREMAFQWILHHPLQALALIPLKIYHEFRPYTWSDAIIYLLAVFGLFSLKKTVEGKILIGLVLINMFAVAVTWSVSGRFLIPLLFVFHVAAAFGMWHLLLLLQQVIFPSHQDPRPSGGVE